ncbi:hypothetical protein ACIBEH_04300 [Nocardia salmonicida]|uniref:hypothetical protein n=1 Tax=Nocardia TaxID=1817 RepID=UPI002659257A|nr:hypothetical protein [Nocardia sp. PE-7]WKG07448.1 hypothetical protein QX204_20340 [Nocardia sp. PE-7]
MRLTMTGLLVCALALPGAGALAHADPAPLPLVSLTTIPDGWSQRTDLRPVLQIFADGEAVHQPDAVSKDRKPETAPKKVTGKVASDVISAAREEIDALKEIDFGIPAGDNRGTQIIDLMPDDPAGEVHLVVYSPEASDGLNPEQKDARKRFTDLYKKLVDAFKS